MTNKKLAFTLAEVLITLAIIGVVAALTIPTLLANYQKRELATRLIKTHAELTQGFKLMMAQDNVSSLLQTRGFSSMTETCSTYASGSDLNIIKDSCKIFREEFLKNFSGSSIILTPYTKLINFDGTQGGVDLYSIRLNNGAFIASSRFYKTPWVSSYDVKSLGGNLESVVVYTRVDVNGAKGPNQFGRDIFIFFVSDLGEVFPEGSRDQSIFSFGDELHTWSGSKPDGNCSTKIKSYGWGCAARVLETGKMDY